MERCCGEVVQPGTEAIWYDWVPTRDPELLDLRLAEGTEEESDVWFEEGGVQVSVSIAEPEVQEGEQMQWSNWTCNDPHVDCLTGPVTVTWQTSGISTEPSMGNGTTASFAAPEPGSFSITFTATLIATPNDNLASGCSAANPGAALSTVTKQQTKTVSGKAVKLTTRTLYDTPQDTTRKTVGIGEHVRCEIAPSPEGDITWVATNHGDVTSRGGLVNTFVAADTPGSSTVSVIMANGKTKPLQFNVLAPNAILIEKNYYEEYEETAFSLKVLVVGNVYFGPDSVNFGHVAFREKDCDATKKWGLYANATDFPAGSPYHIAGSIPWQGDTVFRERGTYTYLDRVKFFYSLLQEHAWEKGGYTWDIPLEYKVDNLPADTEENPWRALSFTVPQRNTIYSNNPDTAKMGVKKSKIDEALKTPPPP